MVDRLNIVIPMYNAAETLLRTLDSLKIIVPEHRQFVCVYGVDDGSFDQTASLFEQGMNAIADLPYVLRKKPNGGSGSARNVFLKDILNGWVLFLDADDELAMDPISLIHSHAGNSSLIFDACYYNNGKYARKKKAVQPNMSNLCRMFSARNPYHPLSIIFRREAMNHFFDEELMYVEDWHFWAVNPQIFTESAVFRGVPLGRIHAGPRSKSAQQYSNGEYRVVAASRIAKFWGDKADLTSRNNFRIQRLIGAVQMGGKAYLKGLTFLPASASLYMKMLIYFFLFKVYLLLYPYK